MRVHRHENISKLPKAQLLVPVRIIPPDRQRRIRNIADHAQPLQAIQEVRIVNPRLAVPREQIERPRQREVLLEAQIALQIFEGPLDGHELFEVVADQVDH